MVNFKTGNSHNGNKPIPCKKCSHPSRDHNRSVKQPDGSWNGPCQYGGCVCKLYERSELIKSLGEWGFKSQNPNSGRLDANQYAHFFPTDGDKSLCGAHSISAIENSEAKKKSKLVFIDEKELDFPYAKCKHCEKVFSFFEKYGKTKTDYYEDNKTYNQPQTVIESERNIQDSEKLNDGFIQIPEGITCSKPGCDETGGTYIKTDESIASQPHFCIPHNPIIKAVLSPSHKKRSTV